MGVIGISQPQISLIGMGPVDHGDQNVQYSNGE
jgi:hypothetical protein